MPHTTIEERLAAMSDENLFGFFAQYIGKGQSQGIPVACLVEIAARWRRANRIIAEIRSKTTMLRGDVPADDMATTKEAIYG
jgi:hypothetical protein